MRQWLTIMSLLILTFAAGAQNKVLEKSSKKAPEWLNTAVENYLVVTVTAPSMAEAQTKAMSEVTERIIQSVASHVSVASTNEMSEENINGQIDSKDTYKRVAKMKSANLPFLQGIAFNKIEAIYWLKLQDKATKKEYYEYSIKYPFSTVEQNELQKQFEALDAEKVAQYNVLEQNIHTLESVEEIQEAITQLDALIEYFFDDVRLIQAKGLKNRYLQLYDALSVTGTFIEEGTYRCQVLLDGNPIKTSTTPKVTSNCAGQLNVRPSDGLFIITYDATDCLPEEENYLNILFRIHGKKLEHKAYLKEAGGAGTSVFSVIPEGKLILTTDSIITEERKIINIHIRLTLNNRGGTSFGLKAIELEVPELTTPLIFDNINAVYTTKGVIQVQALTEGSFTLKQQKKSTLSFVQGAITLVNPHTGNVERKRLSLPYVTNWE